MRRPHIIGRTEKVRQIRDILFEKHYVYLSSFFLSGKTVLMEQVEENLKAQGKEILWFCAGRDDWSAFTREAEARPRAVLFIDDLQCLSENLLTDPRPDPAKEDSAYSGLHSESLTAAIPPLSMRQGALAAFLTSLPPDQCVLMAGRARIPDSLYILVTDGSVTVLDKDFVLFTAEETEQLFLDHGLELPPQDIAYLQKVSWGFPFVLQALAFKMEKDPGHSARALWPEVFMELEFLLASGVSHGFGEKERTLLYSMSPFSSFSGDMAAFVTGKVEAPALLHHIAMNSYALNYDGKNTYSFIPVSRRALFRELKSTKSELFIEEEYSRAAQYCEGAGRIPEAVFYYKKIDNLAKIRELLILDAQLCPANGHYVELRDAYALFPEEEILRSPALMKGMCIIESLRGCPGGSERWYQALQQFIKNTPSDDPRRQEARETAAYLDITLPHRGTKNILKILKVTAGMHSLIRSASWKRGFNVAGNSTSLLNGGKDFSRWVPHGWQIYRIAGHSVEKALGLSGSGLGDIAIGECELESNLTGDYSLAMGKVIVGQSRIRSNPELRCAAIGIQSRILAAEGEFGEAVRLMDSLLEDLPADAPRRLRENLQVQRLTFLLMKGDSRESLSWLETQAPDETRQIIILDRYKYMLKLRLYVMTGQWSRTRILTGMLRIYLDRYERPYMRIQLHLLQAVIDRRTGRESWKTEMQSAVTLAKQYRLVRVIADEGIAVLDMLSAVLAGKTSIPTEHSSETSSADKTTSNPAADERDISWEEAVLRLTRLQASRCPTWLRSVSSRPVFTRREQEVYSLLIAGYKNARIAELLGLSERTVKHYTGKVYQKLGVTTRAEAISRAAEFGDVNR